MMRGRDSFSKVELARESGISTTTMTKLFAQLENAGLIELDRLSQEGFGRPRTLYRLATEHVCVLSCVLDIEKAVVASFGLNGLQNVAARREMETGSGLDGFYDRLANLLTEVREADGRKVLFAVLCVPGLIDQHSGKSVFSPNLHWLENTKPAEEIGARLGIRADVIHEEKVLALSQQSNDENNGNFVLIDFSSGVGAGIFCDGNLLHGHSGFAGEVGHITVVPDGLPCGCGNRGCLETVASDRAYFQALKKGEEGAITEQVLRYQSIGIAAVINLFNPQRVYIHSALAELVPDYLDRIREQTVGRALAPSAAVCSLELAVAGKLQGTALHAINRVMKSE